MQEWEKNARKRIESLDYASPGWRGLGSVGLTTAVELAAAIEEIDRLRAWVADLQEEIAALTAPNK